MTTKRNNKHRKRNTWLLLLAVLTTLVGGAAFLYHPDLLSESVGNVLNTTVSKKEDLESISLSPDSLYSTNAILLRLDDQKVLFQKNSGQKIHPASLTKIMTTLVALENLKDLNEKVVLSPALFPDLYEADASMAGFLPNEEISAISLLYGAMLPSGAECCIGLADHIFGSEQELVKEMNKKAVSLGMAGTRFTNTTGLPDENHYTTVKDLSMLLAYALKNNTFREIFTSQDYTVKPTNKHPDGMIFYNTMFQNMETAKIDDGQILGGKTGYTAKAGLCLASLARKNGKEYMLITVGAAGSHSTEQYNIEDAFAVYRSLKK